VSGYEYEAYLREGYTLVVKHCLGEDELAEFCGESWTWIVDRQAAAAAVLESRACRPAGGTWTWIEVPGSGGYRDYVTTFIRDEALW
jgi:hypothetical protein